MEGYNTKRVKDNEAKSDKNRQRKNDKFRETLRGIDI